MQAMFGSTLLILVILLQGFALIAGLDFPGTKWCGSGHTATSYDDLGTFVETDKCCRAHDKCSYSIGALSNKYGYFNWRPYTISLCDCDVTFKACLKAVVGESVVFVSTADLVGEFYFNVLNAECFECLPVPGQSGLVAVISDTLPGGY